MAACGPREFGPSDLDVEPLLEGESCQSLFIPRLLGKIRQSIRQLELPRTRFVQAQSANQRFSRGYLALLGECQSRCGVGVKRVLARSLEAAEITHRLHPLRELCPRVRRLLNLLVINQRLPRGDGTDPGSARLPGGLQHATRALQSQHLLLVAGELEARRNEEKIQDRKSERAGELHLGNAMVLSDQPLQGENGIGKPRGLRCRRRPRGVIREQRLKGGAIRKRDPNRVVAR